MRVAILSDVHDHLDNLRAALERASEEGAEVLLFCGDLCSPFVVDELSAFGGPVHAVFGNNDGDGFRISRAAAAREDFHLFGEVTLAVYDGETGDAARVEVER